MKELNISAEKENENGCSYFSKQNHPKEIRQIPTIGGEPDLAQYLQVLPGLFFR